MTSAFPATRRRGSIAALCILAAIGLQSCGKSGFQEGWTGLRADAIDHLAVSVPTVALGVNTTKAPGLAGVHAFSSLAGARPRIVMWYQTWAEPLFYPEQVRSLLREGLIPMINWQPTAAHGAGRYSLTAIADGAFDSYIRRSARAAARWGHPMFIDFAHEMNIGGTAWSPGVEGNTPGAYVRAWRHVVRIFRAAGADRVRWLWAPNVDCGGACPFSQFYPGDAWVNWVGLDGYNSGAGSKSRWTEFEEEFGPSYEALTRLTGKPVMIAETASSEAGGDKATWILNMARALETRFTRVRALVWFDRQKEHDWRINSSSASLAAFQQAMKMPPFSQAAQ